MDRKTKWKLYESRCKFCEFYFHKVIRRHICDKYLNFDPVMHFYANQWIMGNTPGTQERFDKWFHRLGELSGFFPAIPELAEAFTDLMLESCKEVNLLAMWHCQMDDYVITEYMPETKLTFLNYLEPWRSKEPWCRVLERGAYGFPLAAKLKKAGK